jgi:hypothetical protein
MGRTCREILQPLCQCDKSVLIVASQVIGTIEGGDPSIGQREIFPIPASSDSTFSPFFPAADSRLRMFVGYFAVAYT